MTVTTQFRSSNSVAPHHRSEPRIAGTAAAFTAHRYNQDEVSSELAQIAGPEFMRFARTAGLTIAISHYRFRATPSYLDSPKRTTPTSRSQLI